MQRVKKSGPVNFLMLTVKRVNTVKLLYWPEFCTGQRFKLRHVFVKNFDDFEPKADEQVNLWYPVL